MKKRLLKVTGRGTGSKKPDLISLDIDLKAKAYEYSNALNKAGLYLEDLRDCLASEGFTREDLRTRDFSVDRLSKNIRKNGDWESIFDGYEISNKIRLEFPMDTERLGRVIYKLGLSKGRPNFSIYFGIQDPQTMEDEILRTAIEDARHRAEVIAQASGVSLVNIDSIDHSYSRMELKTQVNYDSAFTRSLSDSFLDIEADDISSSDDITIYWEIEEN